MQTIDHANAICCFRIDKTMDGLKTKLETAYKASGGRKVNIISHSMGGLLVRCFMSLHNDVRIFLMFQFIKLSVLYFDVNQDLPCC